MTVPESAPSLLARLGRRPATTAVLATVAPTLFVLSQNWYALPWTKAAWLVAVALLSGLALAVLIEVAARGAARVAGLLSDPSDTRAAAIRNALAGTISGLVISALLFRTLQGLLPVAFGPFLAGAGITAAIVYAFFKGWHEGVNRFLTMFAIVACAGWAMSAATSAPPNATALKRDFEAVRFVTKPNVYLFIYDAYGSRDVYRKNFGFDNSAHYDALENKGFKVLHTFSNYDSTWMTTSATFIGAHHYYELEFGNQDTRVGRQMMSLATHNPVLATFKANGYRLQQVHGIDYFVNERGQLDFIYPEEALSSALRLFDLPVLNRLGGRKRRAAVESQTEVLEARIAELSKPAAGPWFTFAHVNLPAHAPGLAWPKLLHFEQVFRDRTATANAHMIATIDRIRRDDPNAVIAIFGDHGAMRYNQIWGKGDPNAAFAESGVSAETVTLDRFGVMIAVASAGRCDRFLYPELTPVNLMRAIFACLADDPAVLERRAEDVALFGGARGALRRVTRDGRPLATWQLFDKSAGEKSR